MAMLGSRSWAEFDATTATSLYWKAVPAVLRLADREEHGSELTVRILSGNSRGTHASRALRVYLSSEADLFFLHTLEVSEEDFSALKAEQGILVDFGSFPAKLISLLEKCIASRVQDPPRFQAVLSSRGGDSTFQIVETNDFKQLPHISLAFRPGNDASVKQFLAFRLSEVHQSHEALTTELRKTKADRDFKETALSDTSRQLAAAKAAVERTVGEWQARSQSSEAAALAAKTQELITLRDQLDRERAEVEAKYREQLETAMLRYEEMDSENRKLRSLKYELDSRVTELSHRLGTAESSAESAAEELGRLRSTSQASAKEKCELDVALADARARASAAEDKIAAQAATLKEKAEHVHNLEAGVRQLEARAEDLKAAAGGHEGRARDAATEVAKGNRIIEKLTGDLRMAKEKARRKAAILARQEEELAQRDAALSSAARDGSAIQRTTEGLTKENSALQAEVEELRGKLEESKTQLQGNEQMIRWLNNQVNEAQVQYGSALAGSRYSYRPGQSPPGVGFSAGAHVTATPSGGGPTSPGTDAAGYRPRLDYGDSPSSGIRSPAGAGAGIGSHGRPVFRGAGYGPSAETYGSGRIGNKYGGLGPSLPPGLTPGRTGDNSSFASPAGRFGNPGTSGAAPGTPLPRSFPSGAAGAELPRSFPSGATGAELPPPRIGNASGAVEGEPLRRVASPSGSSPAQSPAARGASPPVGAAGQAAAQKAVGTSPLGTLRMVGALRGKQPASRSPPVKAAG